MKQTANPRRPRRIRSLAAASCVVAGSLIILLGCLLSYGTKVLFDSDVFADRTAQSLDDPRVAAFVSGSVTDALIRQDRDLTPVRPLILATSRAAISSGPLRSIVRQGVRQVHQLLLTEGGQDILLSLSDVGAVLRSALATQPKIAEMIPEGATVTIASLDPGPLVETARKLLLIGRETRSYTLPAFALGCVLLYLGILLSANRRAALLRSGITLTAIAVLMILGMRLGGSAVAALVDDRALGSALAGVWDTFAGGLRSQAFTIGGIGLLLAAAGTALFEKVEAETFARALYARLRRPAESPLGRLGRAAVLVAAGGVAVSVPGALVELLIVLTGCVALFAGFRELFRLALPLPPRPVSAGVGHVATADSRSYGTARFAIIGAVIVALMVAVAALSTRAPVPSYEAGTIDACNGHPELCDRPLDRVVFPTTHNSMAAADIPEWMFPNQERGIQAQLQDGVRGFMLDVYSGIPVGNAVKTDLEGDKIVREKYEKALGKDGVDAAIRIRNRLIGGKEEDRALYLCHGLCELGAAPLVPALTEIRDFLVKNPNEVLVIIIEDAVAPSGIEAAFRESGLADFVFRGEPGPPWPTLREMIEANERVLVLAENDSSGVPWYHQAFEVVQETPYDFKKPEDFSCEPNRGGTAGSLFLVNHWISTPPSPLPSNAEKANDYDTLLSRARSCQRERGLLPNILAVDFYGTGDLLETVRTLNENPEE